MSFLKSLYMLSLVDAGPWLPCEPLSPHLIPQEDDTLLHLLYTGLYCYTHHTLIYFCSSCVCRPHLTRNCLREGIMSYSSFRPITDISKKFCSVHWWINKIKAVFIPESPPSDFLLGTPPRTPICLDDTKPSNQIKSHHPQKATWDYSTRPLG